MATDHFHEFPGGLFLAADVLRTLDPANFPELIPGEITSDLFLLFFTALQSLSDAPANHPVNNRSSQNSDTAWSDHPT